VSKITVGPVGDGGGVSCAVVDGASGKASVAAGEVVAGGGVVGVVDDCARAVTELRANVQSRVLSAKVDIFIPFLRLLHDV
jgi:predicted RNA methylase